MTEQLALLPDAPLKLTERQQAVADALQQAGQDGLDTDQAGAIAHELKAGRWAHSRDDRCQFCGKDGQAILQRLQALGLARYRRASRDRGIHGAWLAATPETASAAPEPQAPDGPREPGRPVPYNVIPY